MHININAWDNVVQIPTPKREHTSDSCLRKWSDSYAESVGGKRCSRSQGIDDGIVSIFNANEGQDFVSSL